MITPAVLHFEVQRHAPFPAVDPFVLVDETTGVPIDITGATITMQVRLYEGAAGDPLLNETLSVVDGPKGQFGPPSISEAEHEALIAAASADTQNRTSELRLRYDIKVAGVTGMPAAFIAMRGDYVVQTGVTL